jgi:hypothetical protein
LCWLGPRAPVRPAGAGLGDVTLPFAKGDICEASAIRFPAVDSLQPLCAGTPSRAPWIRRTCESRHLRRQGVAGGGLRA